MGMFLDVASFSARVWSQEQERGMTVKDEKYALCCLATVPQLDSDREFLYFLPLLFRTVMQSLGSNSPMKTYLPRVHEIDRKWYLVDAEERVLGRLASRIASVLMGKEKPCYTAFLDTGDFLIVINADKVKLTGNKWDKKIYYSHSGYPGGLKQISARELLDKHPEQLMKKAVKGMLPRNKLGRRMFKKLKVYAGGDHPHQAQKPEPLVLGEE